MELISMTEITCQVTETLFTNVKISHCFSYTLNQAGTAKNVLLSKSFRRSWKQILNRESFWPNSTLKARPADIHSHKAGTNVPHKLALYLNYFCLYAALVIHCQPLSKLLQPKCYKTLKRIQIQPIFGHFRKYQQVKFPTNFHN